MLIGLIQSSERSRKGKESPPLYFRLIEQRTNRSNDMECLIICLFEAKRRRNTKAHHDAYREGNQAKKRQLILFLICPSDNTQETKIAKVSIEHKIEFLTY